MIGPWPLLRRRRRSVADSNEQVVADAVQSLTRARRFTERLSRHKPLARGTIASTEAAVQRYGTQYHP